MHNNTNTFTISTSDESIKHLSSVDKHLGKLISMIGDIECHYHNDGYEFIVEQIVGQMLSNKAAASLQARLREICDGKISPLNVNALSFEDINALGISKQKVGYIKNFTNLIIDSEINLNSLSNLPDEIVYQKLISIRGIGPWTAKMYLLFVLQRSDILPYEDVAFLQAYKWLYSTEQINKESIVKKCKKWSPYSSVAARYMYRALDTGLTKNVFHLFKDEE